jgi:membrane fusion protein, copper/silver efflux system
MKTRNILIPIGTAILGILIGYWIFSISSTTEKEEHITEGQENMEHEVWTCSMHPQIRQGEPGECPICGMDLIPADQGGGDNPLILEMSEDVVELAHIQTSIVTSGNDNATTIGLSGRVEANETTSASLVSHIPGRIEKLYLSFTGEQVYKGQKIASIYSPSLITAQKELIEAYKMKDSQPQLYEAAVNKLKYWKITDKQIDEILESKEIKETFYIYADYSGVVQTRRISVGDYVKQGGVLFNVQNLNKLWVIFDVYEKDLHRVKVGDLITFTTQSIPGEKFSASVSFIDPVINPKTRTADIRIEMSNRNNRLKPDMFVSGELSNFIESEMNIIVPKSAVLWTGQRSVVYVKVPELNIPSFEFREVLLGDEIGSNYQIISGLEVGEEVVTHGAFVIDASAQLNNQASMMNRLVPGAVSEEFLPDFTESTPKKFKAQLEALNKAYLAVKDAFVQTDAAMAGKKTEGILKALKNVDMSLVKGESHNYWMEESKNIKVAVGHISDESDIKIQREYFAELSEAIVQTTKVFGVKSEVYYEQFCPMANGKKGAYWLSTEMEIMNPYFGDKMMTCGETKNTVDQNFKNKMPAMSSNKNMSGHNH